MGQEINPSDKRANHVKEVAFINTVKFSVSSTSKTPSTDCSRVVTG